MKILSLIFFFSIIISSKALGQNKCVCTDTLVNASPLFTHLMDKPDSNKVSREFLTKFLNENISAANLGDDIILEAVIFIGQDGKFCNIKYDKPLSMETENHITEVLKKMPVLFNTCISFKRSIIINPFIKGGENITMVATNMPSFNGCQHNSTKESKNLCTEEKIYKHIYDHPSYNKLNLENGRYIIDFVITTKGKITFFVAKKGKFGDNESLLKKIIEDMPAWEPGTKSTGEIVNFHYTMPLLIK